jgi:O-antigen ligase
MLDTKVTLIKYKPSLWSQHRRLITLALIVGFVALFCNLILGFPIALGLVLIIQVALFFMLFNRPVWAIASIIVGQFTTSNYLLSLGGTEISVRFVWTVLALLLLVPVLRRREGIELGIRVRRIIIPAVIFFGWSTMTMLINTDLSHTIEYLRTSATSIVLIILVPAAIKNEKDIRLLALVALITCTASAIFALGQYYNYLGFPVPAYGLADNFIVEGRVSGLSENPVELGFCLPMVIMPALSIFILKGVQSRTRKLILLVSLIIVWALYVSFTRSGMYSLVPGLLLVVLLMNNKYKKQLVMVTVVLIVAFLLIVSKTGSRYSQGFTSESSAAIRPVLWQAGLFIARDNLIFGIGQDRFDEVSLEYASRIDPALMANLQGIMGRNARGLGLYQAHNDFVTVWAAYGTVALLAYLWVFTGIFRNFLESYRRSTSPFLKSLALGCFGAIITYIVNAFTHNVMDSSQLLWIFGGLSIAATKLALSRPPSVVKEPV